MSAIEAESVFVQVGLQVFRRNGMIDATNSALNQAPESFNAVGVDVAFHIHAPFVPDLAMAIASRLAILPEIFDSMIRRVFVGVDEAAGSNMLANGSEQVSFVCRWNGASEHFSSTLYDPDNRSHFLVAASRSASSVFALTAKIGFVNLHRWPLQLHFVLGEQGANLLEHSPCGFVGDSGFALNLLRRDTATSGTHQVAA